MCIQVDPPVQIHVVQSSQFSRSGVSDSLQPHGLQHVRLPCPTQTPRACSNSFPSSQWCHPKISSSVVPFSSHPQFLPASESFQMISSSQQVAKVLEFQLQHQWIFLLDLLAVQGTRKSLLQHHSSKASILWCSAFFIVQLSYPYMTTGKTIALTRRSFVGKVMSPVFNMLSTFITAFLPRSKRLLISWLKSPSAVILEPKKNEVCHCFHCLPIYLPWSDRTRCHGLSFLNVEF